MFWYKAYRVVLDGYKPRRFVNRMIRLGPIVIMFTTKNEERARYWERHSDAEAITSSILVTDQCNLSDGSYI